jgi:DNA gyrase subunit B
MPEIIAGGHLYIAQPPLYKVSKGRSEVYLKDDAALDQYLVDGGVGTLLLETPAGARSGEDLRGLNEHARRMRTLMGYVPRRYDPAVIEALALIGGFDPALSFEQRRAAAERAAAWQGRADPEATWSATPTEDGGYHFQRLWRGVSDHHIIDAAFVGSAEARKLHLLAAEQAESYAQGSRLVAIKAAEKAAEAVPAGEQAGGEEEDAADAPVLDARGTAISRPSELLEAVFAAGRKGLSISRYKGLGEMNAEQLWETTLDPANRAMLQVEVAQADLADELFTRLMGDVVEPRREFIQENALSVANLDV